MQHLDSTSVDSCRDKQVVTPGCVIQIDMSTAHSYEMFISEVYSRRSRPIGHLQYLMGGSGKREGGACNVSLRRRKTIAAAAADQVATTPTGQSACAAKISPTPATV